MSAEQEVETGRLGALAVLEAGQHETAGRLSCVRGNGWDSAVALTERWCDCRLLTA